MKSFISQRRFVVPFEVALEGLFVTRGPRARHPATTMSRDDDDSSKTSSLHGSESSKSLSSSPPPSQREATEQSRKDIRRERNRQHARVSRERKRKKMQSLEEENVALKARVAELEAALAAR